MTVSENRRETGGRVPHVKTQTDATDAVSQEAATNKKPPLGYGLTETVNETNEKTRHSDGRNPSTQAVTGAGPAVAERSKDARTDEPVRRLDARVKQ